MTPRPAAGHCPPLLIPFWAGKQSFPECCGRWERSCWPSLLSGALASHPAGAAPRTCSHYPCYSAVPTSNFHRFVKPNRMILHRHKIAQMHRFTGPESHAVVLRHSVGLQKKEEKKKGGEGGAGSICNTKCFYNKKPFLASGKQNCYKQLLLWSRWKEKHHLSNTDTEHTDKSSA